MGSRAGKRLLKILAGLITILLLIVLWSMNRVGGYVGSVSVPRAFLCREIRQDIDAVPIAAEKLYPEEKQICVWFEYENAKIGEKIKICCYRNGQLITQKYAALTAQSGTRAFCLVKKDGSVLPLGKYEIVLSTTTSLLHKFNFEVIPKPKPVVINKGKKNMKAGGAKIGKNREKRRKKQSSRHRRRRR